MNLKKVILIVFAVLLVVVIIGAGAVLLLGSGIVEFEEEVEKPTKFGVVEMGRAGNYGYVVYDYVGEGNVTLISYRKESSKDITIIKDDEGIDMDDFEDFVEFLKPLEQYGYTIKISDRRVLGEGVYVVPTGAMPTYVLEDLKTDSTDGVVIYIGKTDLVLRSGMTEENWYDELTPEQKDRILVHDMTLREYMDSGDFNVVNEILENQWSFENMAVYDIRGEGTKTNTVPMENGKYIRIIHDLGDRKGLTDSIALPAETNVLVPEPESKYPWEDSTLKFYLNESEGYAYFSASRNAEEVESTKLSRVVNGSVFIEFLDYKEPGDYILEVTDNTGRLASGILHVKDIEITLSEVIGYNYFFDVTVDGVPLKSGTAEVSLNDGEKSKTTYIDDGMVVVGAKLEKGENIFNFEYEGTKINVPYTYDKENVFDTYIKYGIPGLFLIAIVYVGARLSRRPTYILKATEGSREIRKEVKISSGEIEEAFRNVRRDIKIGKSPITAKEFEIAVKRYITKGADVTEGNIEEMLKKMVNKGTLESYRQYYQFAGEGNIKQKVLMRMIREQLIENGISFRTSKNRFITKDYEIGLYGEKFEGKAIIVVDDANEINKIYDAMSSEDRAKMRIREANGLVTFVPVERLGMVL